MIWLHQTGWCRQNEYRMLLIYKLGSLSQGDAVLQSDHVIETLTKVAICSNKINNINVNQERSALKDLFFMTF